MTRLRRVVPFLFLLAGAVLLLRHALFSRWRGIPWDLRGYHLPLAEFFAASLRAGRLPLWDPYTYCGFPFFANIEAQVFYPPEWLVVLAANRLHGRMADYLEWEVALHLVLAGVFAYALLRRLGCGRAAATFGALTFELGGYFASQAQHLGAICSAAWAPAAWTAVLGLREGVTPRRVAWLAAVLAMSFLAGFPQVFLVVVYSTCILALALVALRQARPVALAGVLLAGAASALLSAAQLVPTWQLTRLSLAPRRGEWFDTAGGVPWQAFVSLLAPDWYHIFEPGRYKLPYNLTFLYLYIGIAGLLFALAALALRRDRAWAPIAVTGLACGLWMMGEHTPVWDTVHRLMPVSLRGPLYAEFAMPGFLLALAVLAGLGAEWVLGRRRAWLGWAVAVLALADLVHMGAGRPMNTTQTRDQDPVVTPTEFEGSRETVAGIHRLTDRTVPPARIDTVEDSMAWGSSASVIGVYTPNGHDPLAPVRIVEVRRLYAAHELWIRWAYVSDAGSRILDLLNVRYLLTWEHVRPAALASARLPLAASLPGHDVYENPRVLPRFFLVHRARAAANLDQALALLRSPDFDPAHEAVVESRIDLPGAGEPPPVYVREYSPHRLSLGTGPAPASLLVTSETWYPGWHATVDGRPQPLLMVNGAFRGVALPPGTHEVRMWFSPAILWWSMVVSAAAWLAALAVLLRRRGKPE